MKFQPYLLVLHIKDHHSHNTNNPSYPTLTCGQLHSPGAASSTIQARALVVPSNLTQLSNQQPYFCALMQRISVIENQLPSYCLITLILQQQLLHKYFSRYVLILVFCALMQRFSVALTCGQLHGSWAASSTIQARALVAL